MVGLVPLSGNALLGVAEGLGIYFRDTAGVLLTNNTVVDGAGDGVRCTADGRSVTNVQVCANRYTGNAGAGIRLVESDVGIEAGLVSTNVVRNNEEGIIGESIPSTAVVTDNPA